MTVPAIARMFRGTRTPRGSRAGGGARHAGLPVAAALALVGVGTVGVGVGPAYADDGGNDRPPRNRIVAQATANAATVSVAGQRQGTGEYISEHDGSDEYTHGENEPALTLPSGEVVTGGGLGQDAVSRADGTSEACAGIVGRNGTIQVGSHESCLDGDSGRVELSLGTLTDLGLGDLLDKLPKPSGQPDGADPADGSDGSGDSGPAPGALPTPGELPDMELVLEGSAITARCKATPDGVTGSSSSLDLTLVGVVAGQRIDLVDLPAEGGKIVLPDLLDALAEGLPEQLGTVLDPVLELLSSGDLPDLPQNPLLTIATNEQVRTDGRLTVNALRVAAVPPTLVEVTAGSVSCGPNTAPAAETPAPDEEPSPETPDDRARVPVSVPAGLAPASGAGDGSGGPDSSGPDSGGQGWVAAAALAAIAVVVGGLLHRRRRTT